MKLTFVGCGDAFGSGGRLNTCFHVTGNAVNFLVDCGASSLVGLKANEVALNLPITPFHFGPAAVVKSIAPRRFSLVAFGLTQVIVDFEPLLYMALGRWPIHRFFHTYLGATVVALAVALLGRPICEAALRLWNRRLSESQKPWLEVNPDISFTAMASGAFFGGYSHVFLDSIMHSDIEPLAPVSDVNGLLYVISIGRLHEVCALAGLLGGAVLLALLVRRKRRIEDST